MRRRRIVLRTIRNGRVSINGVTFAPAPHVHETSVPYTGQLDGQRWAFGLYYGPPDFETYDANGWQRKYIAMWGSEKAYRALETDADRDWPGANCINGYFQWDWWDAVPAQVVEEPQVVDAVDPSADIRESRPRA